ncbi:Transcription termination factor MTERF2, chloroplastic-like protein [Drosera capensis]
MLCPAQHHRLAVDASAFRLPSAAVLHLSATTSHSSHKPSSTTTLRVSLTPNPETTTTPTPQQQRSPILRTHNSKSTAFLLHHLSPSSPQHQPPHQNDHGDDDVLSEEDRVRLWELSLVRKRSPRFPGSILADPPPPRARAESVPPSPLGTLFRDKGHADDDDEEDMLIKAIEIRRKVTAQILNDALQKEGRFGITYATNLVSKMGGFIDCVMIAAAAMKNMPDFSTSSFNVRARIIVDETNVVDLVRWFKHNELSYPQIGKIICMSKGNLKHLRSLAEWLKGIHVKGKFIGTMFLRVGEVILSRSMDELDDNVEYLESKGVRRDWMGYIVGRCPELLAFSMDELKTRVAFYMDMGMKEHDFGTMVYDCPKVLGFLTVDEMKFKVSYIRKFGLNNEDVGRLLAFKPHLMVCGIEEKWKPLIKYLYYLGVSSDGLRKILVTRPIVFCVDLEETIVPKVQFLQEIGVHEDAIGRMIVKFPSLLTYNLQKKIRPKVIFLLTKAGVTRKNIAKVIASAPQLLGRSIAHKLDANVKYFLSLGISLEDLGEMITDFPMILLYNVELLRPKYRYLRRIMVRPLQDLIEFPRYMSYSLEERIMPRHKVLVENRINFTLQDMLAITDEEFNERVVAELRDRERFEAGGALLESEHDKLMDRMQVGLESSEVINDDWSSSNEMRDIGP